MAQKPDTANITRAPISEAEIEDLQPLRPFLTAGFFEIEICSTAGITPWPCPVTPQNTGQPDNGVDNYGQDQGTPYTQKVYQPEAAQQGARSSTDRVEAV